jgi:hypothetical protein
MKYSSLLLDLATKLEIMPSTMDLPPVTKSREENKTNEIIPKKFNGFTSIDIKRSVFPIQIPSPHGSIFVFDPCLRS